MPETNRFARPIEELDAEERHVAEAAINAAHGTFGALADREGSAYFEAAGLTPSETWERVTAELARVSVIAAVEGHRDVDLDVDDIGAIHDGIFAPVFGEGTGFRQKGEGVLFPVFLGTVDRPVQAQYRGVRHKQIRRRLRKALDRFKREVDGLQEASAVGNVPLRAAVLPPVKLYARVIRIHPFADGNGRTAWCVFSYALLRCGLPLVVIPPSIETRWALGMAIRPGGKQDFGPLADIVEQTIKRSAS